MSKKKPRVLAQAMTDEHLRMVLERRRSSAASPISRKNNRRADKARAIKESRND